MSEAIDEKRLEEFVDRAVGDIKGHMVVMMSYLGDRLGLFKALAEAPATAAELAERTGLQTRYVREWARALTCAQYIEYDPESTRFSLPAEHVQVVANEGGPVFFAGMWQEMPALWSIVPQLEDAFREGGGVNIDAYDEDWWNGMERFTGTWFENFLLANWIPEANGIESKLEEGAHVADVGCGRGRALLEIARAYPDVTAVGYDLSEKNVAIANERAEEAGVADRVNFERADVADGLPESFDVVTTFDAAHDFADPAAAFAEIRSALKPGGSYLLLEFRANEKLEDNIGPIGTMLYSISTTYCMTTSLAQGGAGLGTCGLHEKAVRSYCANADFSNVEVIPFDNPFNVLYQANA